MLKWISHTEEKQNTRAEKKSRLIGIFAPDIRLGNVPAENQSTESARHVNILTFLKYGRVYEILDKNYFNDVS